MADADVTFRPDLERLRAMNREDRDAARLRAHFEVERSLATRLKAAARDERSMLYGQLYGELFSTLPDHPQHKMNPERRRLATLGQVTFLKSFVRPDSVYVEVGCGDAAVAQGVAPLVRESVGIDVTGDLINQPVPANFRFVRTAGITFDLPDDYADVIYSNQLMEHLHPDDAEAQLAEIIRVLKPGGSYICSTPSRVTGPHDISVYFGYAPTGFHMREYDYTALAKMFRAAGFRSAKGLVVFKGRQIRVSTALAGLAERIMLATPQALRVRLARLGPVRNLAGLILVGRK